MSKIVFFDIDGTLLDHDKNLPASTKEALEKLKENGIFVAIATGRAPFMFENLRKELDIDSFVSFNGQYVVFEGEPIYKNPLNNQKIEELYKEAKDQGHPVVFMNHQTMKSSVKHHHFIETSLGGLKFAHPEQDDRFYVDRDLFQTLLFCEEGREEFYRENYPEFTFIRWHPYSVDVLPAGGSKAEGIKKMVERLGFKPEDVYAFGDGLNDLEMLEAVGTGVAMGNAVPQLKELANMMTRDVDDDGIWHGLKKLNLI
ncbi:Cof-type HAD-IIB family hydrolase [Bacillus sp. ISL-35]|uniref:Cof-type HAD-IIB family hydrolase n=1 Tax=Bacillus sp. ISL-35 TaxID=2819122 RepID=UPI001BEBA531|nr:Cof-type HAD-IIB family hydrolase [Bacillus sp. ISL-35]MBT2678400.1 Cof-type HAD-IIB family hydrolase [Bacillus sp. ISL-35]MBT2701649.1 Cof-type HAD-IIB family hydrolase [Chryseobacterium sp. ISL-80]